MRDQLNVLHVVDSDQRRGAEMFAADLVQALNERDVHQQVAALEKTAGETVVYQAPFVALSDGVNGSPARIDLTVLRDLRRLIVERNPDLVQAHGGDSIKYVALAAIGTNMPILTRWIGQVRDKIKHGPPRVIYQSLLRRCEFVICPAEFVRNEVEKVFDIPHSRVVAIPNGVDRRRLKVERGREATRRQLGIPVEDFVAVSVGAFTWEKDPLATVEVAKYLLAQRSDAWHLFAGDGPLRPKVVQALSRIEGARIRLLGNRADIGDLLEASDVMILTSRTEGMPGAVIEAGMHGVPVVAYAVAGVPEVVLHGETGILVEPGDQETLGRALVSLANDPETLARMGRAAGRHCAQFEIGPIASRYLDLYREVVAGRHREGLHAKSPPASSRRW